MTVTLMERLPSGWRARVCFFIYLPFLFTMKLLGQFEMTRNMAQVNKYNELVVKYGKSVNFLTIYIREAHASDGEWPDTRTCSIKNHRTLTDRMEAAAGLQEFGVAGRLLVDSMDDHSLLHYGALPERLCVIGTNGIVLYLGGMGPWGYSLNDLEHCLENLI